MSIRTSRKILVPLATLVAAGAVAIGSGATFTSESSNSVSAVTAGTLTQSNSMAGANIALPPVKPGDKFIGSLTLTNTGTLPATYTLSEPASTNGYDSPSGAGSSYLRLKVTHGSTVLYDGDFGGLAPTEKLDLGQFDSGEAKTYTFQISLDQAAPNSQQGKTGSATFTWTGTQLDGETSSM